MANIFGSAQAADLSASGKRQITGQAVEKAAGVKINPPGGVGEARNRRRRDLATGFSRPAIRRCPAAYAGACRERHSNRPNLLSDVPRRKPRPGEFGEVAVRVLCQIGLKFVAPIAVLHRVPKSKIELICSDIGGRRYWRARE